MGPPWAGSLRGELEEKIALGPAYIIADSTAKLVRLSEGVKLVVQVDHTMVAKASLARKGSWIFPEMARLFGIIVGVSQPANQATPGLSGDHDGVIRAGTASRSKCDP